MKSENVGSIPVVEGDRLVAIVTDRDIAIKRRRRGQEPRTRRRARSPRAILSRSIRTRASTRPPA